MACRFGCSLFVPCDTGNYANFLKAQGELDEAEKYYRVAISVAPHNATVLGNYANFLLKQRHDPPAAKRMYAITCLFLWFCFPFVLCSVGLALDLRCVVLWVLTVGLFCVIRYVRAIRADPQHPQVQRN